MGATHRIERNVLKINAANGATSTSTSVLPKPRHISTLPLVRHYLFQSLVQIPSGLPYLHRRLPRGPHTFSYPVSHQEYAFTMQCSFGSIDQCTLLGNKCRRYFSPSTSFCFPHLGQ